MLPYLHLREVRTTLLFFVFGTSTLIMPLQYVSNGIDLLVLILSHWTHNSTILEVDAILVYKISYDL